MIKEPEDEAFEELEKAQQRREAERVQEPVIDKSAAVRIATALGWEPKREWKTLTDAQYQDILKQTEGCGHLAFYHLIDKALREANT